MREIKFVSYDGKYPNLCSGELILSVDGELFTFRNCLISGGRAGVNFDTYEEYCTKGDWCLHWYDEVNGVRLGGSYRVRFTPEEIEFITQLVNENIPHGCCGGCI